VDLSSLYQELILKHYRRPTHRGELADADAAVHVLNPTCGDEIVLHLKVRGGRVEAVRFGGQGCSISQASASMMAERIEGRTLEEVHQIAERFKELLHGSEDAARDKALGDLRALAGVAKLPVRVRCAMLGWDALEQAERQLQAHPNSGADAASA
jgi:nitrogen fixation NifU-like protein